MSCHAALQLYKLPLRPCCPAAAVSVIAGEYSQPGSARTTGDSIPGTGVQFGSPGSTPRSSSRVPATGACCCLVCCQSLHGSWLTACVKFITLGSYHIFLMMLHCIISEGLVLHALHTDYRGRFFDSLLIAG